MAYETPTCGEDLGRCHAVSLLLELLSMHMCMQPGNGL